MGYKNTKNCQRIMSKKVEIYNMYNLAHPLFVIVFVFYALFCKPNPHPQIYGLFDEVSHALSCIWEGYVMSIEIRILLSRFVIFIETNCHIAFDYQYLVGYSIVGSFKCRISALSAHLSIICCVLINLQGKYFIQIEDNIKLTINLIGRINEMFFIFYFLAQHSLSFYILTTPIVLYSLLLFVQFSLISILFMLYSTNSIIIL